MYLPIDLHSVVAALTAVAAEILKFWRFVELL